MNLLKDIERKIRLAIRGRQKKRQFIDAVRDSARAHIGTQLINGQSRESQFIAAVRDVMEADIAIHVTGGLGDLIVVARFLRDFLQSIGGATFVILYNEPDIANMVFASVPGYRKSFHEIYFGDVKDSFRYAFTINQFFFVDRLDEAKSAFVRDHERHADIVSKVNHIAAKQEPVNRLKDNHPFLDGALGHYASFKGFGRSQFLHYLAGIDYGGDQLAIDYDAAAPERFGLVPGQYITVHNGYDDAMAGHRKRTTKVYPGWNNVIAILKRSGFNELSFVQIGTPKTSELIDSADVDLVGKTSLREAVALVANSAFHLDNEGGFVHVASAFGRRSCVVFGPTSVDYFGYRDNINIRPRECGDCWWVERTWMINCARGLDEPVCMSTHEPEAIAAEIMTALKWKVDKLRLIE
ncbi:MAG: glycosyltransferase family 9 protein [Ancalomicrobiaceae bacterium]|nr:glycosyltransferase family 9 protein [Ancalomicrobiaceae bacterium]